MLPLCSCCCVAVSVLCLFLAVPRVVLLSVIRVFPGHYETISYLSVQQSKLSLRGAEDDPMSLLHVAEKTKKNNKQTKNKSA